MVSDIFGCPKIHGLILKSLHVSQGLLVDQKDWDEAAVGGYG